MNTKTLSEKQIYDLKALEQLRIAILNNIHYDARITNMNDIRSYCYIEKSRSVKDDHHL